MSERDVLCTNTSLLRRILVVAVVSSSPVDDDLHLNTVVLTFGDDLQEVHPQPYLYSAGSIPSEFIVLSCGLQILASAPDALLG